MQYKTSQSDSTLPLSVTWLRGSSFGRENPETPVSSALIHSFTRNHDVGLEAAFYPLMRKPPRFVPNLGISELYVYCYVTCVVFPLRIGC